METYLPLIGIVIIVIGFALKLDTIGVVVIAGLVTALVSGLSLTEFLTILGDSFVNQRITTLFVLTLTMVGLSERYGMKEQAVRLISNLKNLTAGRFLSLYLFIRELAGAFSIRLGGHPQFIRPLIDPMAQAAVVNQYGNNDKEEQMIKGQAAAMENIGNFYSQNVFVGAAGTQMIAGFLNEAGFDFAADAIARASIPVAIIALVLGVLYNHQMDRQIASYHQADNKGGR